jgi:hypothetical protein
MGWHYILFLKCQLLPEYIDFIKHRYMLREFADSSDESDGETMCETIPPNYRRLLDYWSRLNIDPSCYNYDLKPSGEFICHFEKKVGRYRGDLWKAYEEFLKHIIVPITSEITECRIEEDDMGCQCEVYTDAQLRNIQFNLKDLVADVEHVYEDDMIVETRVRYKRPFRKSQELDVTRMFMR